MSVPRVISFGCRLNAYESEIMRAKAAQAGAGDAIILNTCAVTTEATRQARQAIRRARRDNPAARIVVTGCAAQIEPERFAAMPEVDLVLGNAEKLLAESYAPGEAAGAGCDLGESSPSGGPHPDPPPRGGREQNRAPSLPSPSGGGVGGGVRLANDNLKSSRSRAGISAAVSATTIPHAPSPGAVVKVGDIMSLREAAAHMIDGLSDRTRAFIEVQTGCDHRCTFCIIPLARGMSRSVPAAAVVEQVRRLAADGIAEAVLTGVDITAYGADLAGAPQLGGLVRLILKSVPELRRLRLSSLDTIEADPELHAAIAEEERLMPHFHLSLQSGDDLILKRMKRRHTRAQAVAFCDDVRRRRTDAVFGADLIAGFPTETRAMAENSVNLIEDCGLTFLHVFPFSPRPGTPAERMPRLAPDIVRARARRLRETGARALGRFLDREIGATREVLVEKGNVARTPQFAAVRLAGEARPGSLRQARIVGRGGDHLVGALVQ